MKAETWSSETQWLQCSDSGRKLSVLRGAPQEVMMCESAVAWLALSNWFDLCLPATGLSAYAGCYCFLRCLCNKLRRILAELQREWPKKSSKKLINNLHRTREKAGFLEFGNSFQPVQHSKRTFLADTVTFCSWPRCYTFLWRREGRWGGAAPADRFLKRVPFKNRKQRWAMSVSACTCSLNKHSRDSDVMPVLACCLFPWQSH